MTEDPTPSPNGSPEEAPTGARRIARLVDEGVFRVEKSLVTIASLVMTATVGLDILYRSFETSESMLARKLLGIFGLFGLDQSEGNYEVLRDIATPVILVVTVFLFGWAIYVAARRAADEESSLRQGLIWGAVCVVGCWVGLELILYFSSRWVCTALMVLGCGWWFRLSLKNGRRLDAVLAIALTVAGWFACATLPEAYSWSQELSLILLAWVAFLGGSIATRAQRHIQVDALSKLVPERYRPYTRATGLLLTALFCAYLTGLAYHHVFGPMGDYSSGEIRPSTGLPAWIIILSAMVSFGLMTLRFGAYTVDAFADPRLPDQDLLH